MNRHASMNRIYRLVWSDALRAYVPAAETARGRGKRSKRKLKLSAFTLSASIASIAWANPPEVHLTVGSGTLAPSGSTTLSAGNSSLAPEFLPTGAQVPAGAATITTSGDTLTIDQASERAAIDWQTFSIGSKASVDFVQPNAGAVVLNRVVGNEQSVIDGALDANGQVFILNSSGILFARNARIDTGGLVASTLQLSDADFMAGHTSFAANGSKSSLINLGMLAAKDGGYIALLGQQVSNDGVITARLGTVVLAGGNRVSLNFNGSSLLGVTVDVGALNALVQNQQAILADGGTIILSAKGLDAVMAAAVNNTGEIRAQSIGEKNGKIYLLGDMQTATVEVGGMIDAGAPNGGDGGFIETSAATVKISPDAVVSTAAAMGLKGSWLVDPNDFTVAPTAGDITGAALSAALQSGNVTIQTTSGAAGCSGATCGSGTSGVGDINIDDTVTWSANRLTLNAYNNITVNVPMNGSGTASLSLMYGQGAANGVVNSVTATYNINAPITLPVGNNFTTQLGSTGSVTTYQVIGSAAALQNINNSLAGNFALGNDMTLSGNFTPISTFTGNFEGLGHVISGLTEPSGNGLFSTVNSLVRDVGLSGANVGGGGGALVGNCNYCTIINSYSVNGTVSGGYQVGGLVGVNYNGTITNSYSTGSVSGSSAVGGLVGWNSAQGGEFNSYSTATVTGSSGGYAVGGLVGENEGATISNSHATGAVLGGDPGGLVGMNTLGTVTVSYATGNVTATGLGNYGTAGGLVAYNTGSIDRSFASGNVTSIGGGSYVGGLVGNNLGSISNTYARGNVSVSGPGSYGKVGGLVGYNSGSFGTPATLTNSFSTGTVTSTRNGDYVNAVVGYGQYNSTISNTFWDTTTSQIPASTGGIGVGFGSFTATGLATSDMKTAVNFITQGWDFTTPVWSISSGVNDGYPHLCAITSCAAPTPLYAEPSAGSSVYGTAPVISYAIVNGNGAYVFLNGASATGTAQYTGAPSATSNAGTYSITYTSGLSLTGVAASDYTLQPYGSATTWTVDPKPLSLAGSVAYNGSGIISASAFGNAGTIPTGIGGQTVDLTGSGSVASANVSAGTQTLSLGSLTLTNGTGLASNYTLIGGTDTVSISPLPVTVTGTRPYDGSTAVATNLLSISNLVGSDSASLSGTATLSSAAAGIQTLNLSGLSVSNTNYTLTGGNGTMDVTALPVTVAAVTGATRVYNGSTAAPSNLLTITNVVTGDSVTLSGTATLAGSGVGAENLVSLSGLSLNNPNYTLSGGATSGSVTITPRPVTVAAASGASEVYNGSTAAPSNLLTITNVVTGDSVTLSGTATLAGSGVGAENLVSLSGLSLNNPNYTLSGGVVSGSVLITAASGTAPGTPEVSPYVDSSAAVADTTIPQSPAEELSQSIVTPVPNVVVTPASLIATFGSGALLSVVTAPDGNEPTAVVGLSQAREMLKSQGTAAAADGTIPPPEVRVPVSRNSLAEIVNGGVKLPSGVEQQLFVIKAN